MEENKVEVVHEEGSVVLAVALVTYPEGPNSYAIAPMLAHEVPEWEPDCFDIPPRTAYLNAEHLDAIVRWWVGKHPELIATLLTDEQRKYLDLTKRFHEAVMAGSVNTYVTTDDLTHSVAILRSLLGEEV